MSTDLNEVNDESSGDLISEDEMGPRHQRSFDPSEYPHSELTEKIIAAFFKVYNTLGYGFLEKVYENAMIHELSGMDLEVKAQHPITVTYEEAQVGSYFADLVIEDSVIVEPKAAEELRIEHECQLVNYLKATDKEVGLLLNFGIKPRIKRKIHTKNYQR